MSKLKEGLRAIKQEIYHRLGLYPIYKVVAAINTRIELGGSSILEAFAYTGAWQTRAFSHLPKYLEAWEIDQACLSELKKNLPEAEIKITNSFEEVLRCDKKFDFINVDTHQGIYGDYCENFEFFPLLFRVAKENFVVNLNVIPEAGASWRKKYPSLFNAEHLDRRKKFYGVVNPENVSLDQMLETYGRIANEKGYNIVWHYYLQRTLTYYLVLHFKKQS